MNKFTNYIHPGELCGEYTAIRYLGGSKWVVQCSECLNTYVRHSANFRRGGPCQKCAAKKKSNKWRKR